MTISSISNFSQLKIRRITALRRSPAFGVSMLTVIGSALALFLSETAHAGTYRLEFKTAKQSDPMTKEDVVLDLVTSDILETITHTIPADPPTFPGPDSYTFTGYKILSISGTDGGKPIAGIRDPYQIMPAIVNGTRTFIADNYFNPLGGGATPNQLSNGAYGGGLMYAIEELPGSFRDYQFYYGLRDGSAVLDYQGCFPTSRNTTPPPTAPPASSTCKSLIITDFKSSTQAPAPLTILGAGIAFGSVGKLKKFSSQLKSQSLG